MLSRLPLLSFTPRPLVKPPGASSGFLGLSSTFSNFSSSAIPSAAGPTFLRGFGTISAMIPQFHPLFSRRPHPHGPFSHSVAIESSESFLSPCLPQCTTYTLPSFCANNKRYVSASPDHATTPPTPYSFAAPFRFSNTSHEILSSPFLPQYANIMRYVSASPIHATIPSILYSSADSSVFFNISNDSRLLTRCWVPSATCTLLIPYLMPLIRK